MARLGRAQPFAPKFRGFRLGTATIVVSGTIIGAAESDIVAGGKTIILTVTGDSWVASGATFDAQRANIIAGLTSAGAELLGWNNTVKTLQGVAGVVQTSPSVVTITLDARPSYTITVNETITVTVPGTALLLGSALVATPTFTITDGGAVTVFQTAQCVYMSGPMTMFRAGRAA